MNELKSTWLIEFFRHSFPTLAAAKSFVRGKFQELDDPNCLVGEEIIHYINHKPKANVIINISSFDRVSFSRVHPL